MNEKCARALRAAQDHFCYKTNTQKKTKKTKNAVMVKGYWDDHRQVCL